ncbi:glutamate synthase [Bythopirellula polymerisocia]|uniref:Putative selenate reductase subunit YgfK n=1 Tax=Bythopirellula polymerisocia TaxID=2528003 RepID=A0A5C6CEG3_9BACT|nr:glutamate synthase [Bythopirellula polymerisocia]TWU22658.1 putative selenate reductase subunit YgfK [Bythopirellula polymerisocia]
MVDLYCTPFVELVDRIRLEYANRESMFDLPRRKWYVPDANDSTDLTVRFHGQLAGNPLGPASGPQTQMAQNLVLSWLAGSRIMELKTVQINDALEIARPCIDATNVGYNIEWSQELKVHESLDQYVQGAMLIHMLRNAPQEFGNPCGETDMAGTLGETVFDMSVGYDLAGIQTDKVVGFIRGMMDATESVNRLRDQLPHRLRALRDLDYPTALSRSITLSTFHGCPADEIERICEFLLTEIGTDVIVKMNPPMLGKGRLEALLYDVMGYTEITVNPHAYSSGLMFDESIAMCGRLAKLATERNMGFGAKFSNTLEVNNHREFFPEKEKVMYLSGLPLHVITLTLAHEFRKQVGHVMPISFSAGIDRKNAANAIACGFVPVTTCTDLLRVGGYGRLPAYFQDLRKAMDACGATTIDDYLLDCCGNRAAAGGDPLHAGFLNMETIVAKTQADNRYYAEHNRSIPKKIDSHLTTFDCITCDKCIPVCPNDANFTYAVEAVDISYRDLEVQPDGTLVEVGDEKPFRVEKAEQIANFADYCNHCGNCDTFCPEYDGPYLMKPSFFGSREAFEAGSPHDGFQLENENGEICLNARIAGDLCHLSLSAKGEYCFHDGTITLASSRANFTLAENSLHPSESHTIDMGRFHALVTLLKGITSDARIHAVNTPLVAEQV